MSNDNQKLFRNILPMALIEKGISLESMGHDEYVWKWRDALDVIDILINNNIRILGGDVYSNVTGRFKPTYDNWYINKREDDTTESILQRSRIISRDYIDAYVKNNGEDYYFSIVAGF